MNDTQETQAIKYRQIGSRDLYAMIKTGEMYSFDVTYNPLDTDLLQYAINTEDEGTKNVSKSLTFIKSQLVNGTEMYTIYRGCKPESLDVTITADGAVEVAATYQCKEITTPATTHGLGTVTWGTNPTATPWTNQSSGIGPLRLGTGAHPVTPGPTTTIDTNNFTMSVTHNLEQVRVNGDPTVKFVEPTLRDVTFEFDALYHDTGLIIDQKALSAKTMEYVLKSTPGARLDFTDAFLETLGTSDATTSTEPKILSFTGTAKRVSVTTI